jgi:CRISPR-associated protein Cmr5
MQSKQQKRADFALKSLESLPGIGGGIDEKTANFIVGTPTMILTNGIGQTLAFLLSKKTGKEKQVYDVLKEWLHQEMPDCFGQAGNSDIDFLRAFNRMSQEDYLRAQREALRLLEWLKRYARAFQVEGPKE